MKNKKKVCVSIACGMLILAVCIAVPFALHRNRNKTAGVNESAIGGSEQMKETRDTSDQTSRKDDFADNVVNEQKNSNSENQSDRGNHQQNSNQRTLSEEMKNPEDTNIDNGENLKEDTPEEKTDGNTLKKDPYELPIIPVQ